KDPGGELRRSVVERERDGLRGSRGAGRTKPERHDLSRESAPLELLLAGRTRERELRIRGHPGRDVNVDARARLTPVEAVDDAQRLTRHEIRSPRRNSSVDEDPAGALVGAKNVSLDVQEVA